MPDAPDLYASAMESVRAGNFDGARELLTQALAASRDPDERALIEQSDAYVEAELHGADAGLARLTALLEVPDLETETYGTIWGQVGLLEMRAGDSSAALAAYERALSMVTAPEPLGRTLLNRGILHLQLGDPTSALTDLEAAHERLSETGLELQSAKALHNQGYAHLLAGDLVQALKLMDAAAEVIAPLSPVSEAMCNQDRAEALVAAGRLRDAVQALEAAARAYGENGLGRFQAECELVLARTLLATSPERARQVAEGAARRFAEHDSPVWGERAEALALIAAIESHAPVRLSAADALATRLRAEGLRREAEQLGLHAARLALDTGDPDEAANRLRALRVRRSTPVTTRLLAREVRAELASARGRRRRARDHVRAGLHDLHAWQASFGSLDLQSTLVGHGNHLARMGLELALEDGSPDVVLEWSERARALASRVTRVRPPDDPQLAADLTELRLLAGDDAVRARELRERISRQSWYGEGGGALDELVGLDELQSVLAARDTALVAPIALADSITALVVTGSSATVVPLGAAPDVRGILDRVAADLDMAAAHRTGGFGAAIRAGLTADLERVATRLVEPWLPLVGERRVVLTPSALLTGTPWSLLLGLTGRPLTVAPSASRWVRTLGGLSSPRVGLVAGPGVERASEEVARGAAAWRRADLLHGADATAPKVAELASRVDVLHLAGHGRHAGDHPLFSAIGLTDGWWFGHDIDLLPRVPRLVVLSACELGSSSVRSSEETVGMTAAWLHAGAATVVSSPVLVADDVACEVLADWHARIASGDAPADALADAEAAVDDIVPFLCFGAGW